jgi:GT2 family glycosyltransferase
LFPRQILEEVEGYDKNFTFGFEDWELNIRLLQRGYDFCNVDEVLFNYWVSKNGMLISKSLKQYTNIFTTIEKKHYLTYSLPSIIKLFIKSRNSKAKRNLWIYFVYSIISKVASRRVFSFLTNAYLRKNLK